MAPRLIIIGDIHGCPATLDELLDRVAPGCEDTLVFLGDYIDRGPDSPGVIDRLRTLHAALPNTIFLRGNHDAMLLDFLSAGTTGYGAAYLHPANGGRSTLEQYGCARAALDLCELTSHAPSGSVLEDISAAIPHSHIEFLLSTLLRHETDDVLCVHAGISPEKSLDQQTSDDLLWIRAPFVSMPHTLPQLIVYGHTPTHDCDFQPRWDLENRKVGIDTGCVYGGALTALIWPALDTVSIPNRDVL
jgi:serine/threonine protein phosphatase 1